jgi:hypothetical protein
MFTLLLFHLSLNLHHHVMFLLVHVVTFLLVSFHDLVFVVFFRFFSCTSPRATRVQSGPTELSSAQEMFCVLHDAIGLMTYMRAEVSTRRNSLVCGVSTEQAGVYFDL